jgi:hypothetical protein
MKECINYKGFLSHAALDRDHIFLTLYKNILLNYSIPHYVYLWICMNGAENKQIQLDSQER